MADLSGHQLGVDCGANFVIESLYDTGLGTGRAGMNMVNEDWAVSAYQYTLNGQEQVNAVLYRRGADGRFEPYDSDSRDFKSLDEFREFMSRLERGGIPDPIR